MGVPYMGVGWLAMILQQSWNIIKNGYRYKFFIYTSTTSRNTCASQTLRIQLLVAKNQLTSTLPKTNIFAPKNLDALDFRDNPFILGLKGLFSGAKMLVSWRVNSYMVFVEVSRDC